MDMKPHIFFIGIICLLLASVSAQDEAKNCPKLIAQNENVRGIVKLDDANDIEISGVATYTIKAINADVSVAGEFAYVLSNESRKKIARRMKKELAEIPTTIEVKDSVADFINLTQCPVVRVEIAPMELRIVRVPLQIKQSVLILQDKRDDRVTMLCRLARHIKLGLPARRCWRCINDRINCRLSKESLN